MALIVWAIKTDTLSTLLEPTTPITFDPYQTIGKYWWYYACFPFFITFSIFVFIQLFPMIGINWITKYLFPWLCKITRQQQFIQCTQSSTIRMTRSSCQNQQNETPSSINRTTPRRSKLTTRIYGRNFQWYGSSRTPSDPQKILCMRQQNHQNMMKSQVWRTTNAQIFTLSLTFHSISTSIIIQICFFFRQFFTNWPISNSFKIPSQWGIYSSLCTTSQSWTIDIDYQTKTRTIFQQHFSCINCNYSGQATNAKSHNGLDQLSRRSRITIQSHHCQGWLIRRNQRSSAGYCYDCFTIFLLSLIHCLLLYAQMIIIPFSSLPHFLSVALCCSYLSSIFVHGAMMQPYVSFLLTHCHNAALQLFIHSHSLESI